MPHSSHLHVAAPPPPSPPPPPPSPSRAAPSAAPQKAHPSLNPSNVDGRPCARAAAALQSAAEGISIVWTAGLRGLTIRLGG